MTQNVYIVWLVTDEDEAARCGSVMGVFHLKEDADDACERIKEKKTALGIVQVLSWVEEWTVR